MASENPQGGAPLAEPGFSVRLLAIEYYMAPPLAGVDTCYSHFQGRVIDQVPVVRVYGSTPAGQKTCLHLHKAFPYFYVIYDDDLPQEIAQGQHLWWRHLDAQAYVRRLGAAIERAMKLASAMGGKRQHVHACSLVRATPFYGFHPAQSLFVKIVLYQPREVSRAITFLQSGALLGRKFQPYEAHIPYLLQLMVDYNLSGMGFIHMSRVRLRPPLPEAARSAQLSLDMPQLMKAASCQAYRALGHGQAPTHTAGQRQQDTGAVRPPPACVAAHSTPQQPSPQELATHDNVHNSGSNHNSTGVSNAIALETTTTTTTTTNTASTIHGAHAKIGLDETQTINWSLQTEAAHGATFEKSGAGGADLWEASSPAEKAGQKPPGGSIRSPQSASTHSSPSELGGRQPRVFVRGHVPAGWSWPGSGSGGGGGMHGVPTKQSTCELEADACVEDILNVMEMNSTPLEDAGADVQMVPSLAPIWEDERRRNGANAATGAQPSPARELPPVSELEQSLRRAVYLLAEEDEANLRAQRCQPEETEEGVRQREGSKSPGGKDNETREIENGEEGGGREQQGNRDASGGGGEGACVVAAVSLASTPGGRLGTVEEGEEEQGEGEGKEEEAGAKERLLELIEDPQDEHDDLLLETPEAEAQEEEEEHMEGGEGGGEEGKEWKQVGRGGAGFEPRDASGSGRAHAGGGSGRRPEAIQGPGLRAEAEAEAEAASSPVGPDGGAVAQVGVSKSRRGGGSSSSGGSFEVRRALLRSLPQPALLACSQPANAAPAAAADWPDISARAELLPGATAPADSSDGGMAGGKDVAQLAGAAASQRLEEVQEEEQEEEDVDAVALTQLSQRDEQAGVDRALAELLEWMGDSQGLREEGSLGGSLSARGVGGGGGGGYDATAGAGAEDEVEVEVASQRAARQVANEHGVQMALQRALREHEVATQRECRAILDSVLEAEEEIDEAEAERGVGTRDPRLAQGEWAIDEDMEEEEKGEEEGAEQGEREQEGGSAPQQQQQLQEEVEERCEEEEGVGSGANMMTMMMMEIEDMGYPAAAGTGRQRSWAEEDGRGRGRGGGTGGASADEAGHGFVAGESVGGGGGAGGGGVAGGDWSVAAGAGSGAGGPHGLPEAGRGGGSGDAHRAKRKVGGGGAGAEQAEQRQIERKRTWRYIPQADGAHDDSDNDECVFVGVRDSRATAKKGGGGAGEGAGRGGQGRGVAASERTSGGGQLKLKNASCAESRLRRGQVHAPLLRAGGWTGTAGPSHIARGLATRAGGGVPASKRKEMETEQGQEKEEEEDKEEEQRVTVGASKGSSGVGPSRRQRVRMGGSSQAEVGGGGSQSSLGQSGRSWGPLPLAAGQVAPPPAQPSRVPAGEEETPSRPARARRVGEGLGASVPVKKHKEVHSRGTTVRGEVTGVLHRASRSGDGSSKGPLSARASRSRERERGRAREGDGEAGKVPTRAKEMSVRDMMRWRRSRRPQKRRHVTAPEEEGEEAQPAGIDKRAEEKREHIRKPAGVDSGRRPAGTAAPPKRRSSVVVTEAGSIHGSIPGPLLPQHQPTTAVLDDSLNAEEPPGRSPLEPCGGIRRASGRVRATDEAGPAQSQLLGGGSPVQRGPGEPQGVPAAGRALECDDDQGMARENKHVLEPPGGGTLEEGKLLSPSPSPSLLSPLSTCPTTSAAQTEPSCGLAVGDEPDHPNGPGPEGHGQHPALLPATGGDGRDCGGGQGSEGTPLGATPWLQATMCISETEKLDTVAEPGIVPGGTLVLEAGSAADVGPQPYLDTTDAAAFAMATAGTSPVGDAGAVVEMDGDPLGTPPGGTLLLGCVGTAGSAGVPVRGGFGACARLVQQEQKQQAMDEEVEEDCCALNSNQEEEEEEVPDSDSTATPFAQRTCKWSLSFSDIPFATLTVPDSASPSLVSSSQLGNLPPTAALAAQSSFDATLEAAEEAEEEGGKSKPLEGQPGISPAARLGKDAHLAGARRLYLSPRGQSDAESAGQLRQVADVDTLRSQWKSEGDREQPEQEEEDEGIEREEVTAEPETATWPAGTLGMGEGASGDCFWGRPPLALFLEASTPRGGPEPDEETTAGMHVLQVSGGRPLDASGAVSDEVAPCAEEAEAVHGDAEARRENMADVVVLPESLHEQESLPSDGGGGDIHGTSPVLARARQAAEAGVPAGAEGLPDELSPTCAHKVAAEAHPAGGDTCAPVVAPELLSLAPEEETLLPLPLPLPLTEVGSQGESVAVPSRGGSCIAAAACDAPEVALDLAASLRQTEQVASVGGEGIQERAATAEEAAAAAGGGGEGGVGDCQEEEEDKGEGNRREPSFPPLPHALPGGKLEEEEEEEEARFPSRSQKSTTLAPALPSPLSSPVVPPLLVGQLPSPPPDLSAKGAPLMVLPPFSPADLSARGVAQIAACPQSLAKHRFPASPPPPPSPPAPAPPPQSTPVSPSSLEPPPGPSGSSGPHAGQPEAEAEAGVGTEAGRGCAERQQCQQEGLLALKYHKPPPGKHELASTWEAHGLTPVAWGSVFYGNPADVADRPLVMGGMEFNVRSQEARDLPPFTFGTSEARDGSRAAPGGGVSERDWQPPVGIEPLAGLSSHFDTDGSLSYLVSPVRPPPSRATVLRWLAYNPPDGTFAVSNSTLRLATGRGEGAIFTMDANTGKLVPAGDATAGGSPGQYRGPGLAAGTGRGGRGFLESQQPQEQEEEEEPLAKPSSPKYDEHHVLMASQLSSPGSPSQGAFASPSTPFSLRPFLTPLPPPPGGRRGAMRPPPPRASRHTPGATAAALKPQAHAPAPHIPASPHSSDVGQALVPIVPSIASKNRTHSAVHVSSAAVTPANPRPGAVSPGLLEPQQQLPPGTLQSGPHPRGVPQGGSPRSWQVPSSKETPVSPPPPPPPRLPPGGVSMGPPVVPTRGARTSEKQQESRKKIPMSPLAALLSLPGGASSVRSPPAKWKDVSQITPFTPVKGRVQGTPLSQAGFREAAATTTGGQQVSAMSIEVHACSRGDMRPDPRHDPIGCICICMQDEATLPASVTHGYVSLTLLLDESVKPSASKGYPLAREGLVGCQMAAFPSEAALFQALVALVRAYDPDILVGWEVQGASLGFLAERAAALGIGLLKQLSRTPPPPARSKPRQDVEEQRMQPQGEGAGCVGGSRGIDGVGGPTGAAAAAAAVRQPSSAAQEGEFGGAPHLLGGAVLHAADQRAPGDAAASGRSVPAVAGGGSTWQMNGSSGNARVGMAVGEGPAHGEGQQRRGATSDFRAAFPSGAAALAGAACEGAAASGLEGQPGRQLAMGGGPGPGAGAALAGGGTAPLGASAAAAAVFPGVVAEVAGVGNEPVIEDEWGRTHGSGLHIGGRIVLNLWRIMRGEVKLPIYTLHAVAEAVLRRRVPRFSCRQLSAWFGQGTGGGARWRCLEHFADRARLNLQIMDQLDLVNRTAELARVFGIDFFAVLSRGSQYRVEAMMVRLAHSQNYLLLSASRLQVAQQPAMECLPLVMEPESRLYTSPVVVLDFQALYPSMIIAYNLCFSTCLGRIARANPKQLGVSSLTLQAGVLAALKQCLHLLPNSVMYAPPEVRPGVLPRLLREILATRIMVKQAMKKLGPPDKVLHRILNARQFALKLIANVTYGYTAAGFSGRMPCAEVADSIVQAGRHTLERAIAVVNSHPRWGARVVYGDTDSMFVLLEGRTRDAAFAIGQEIAAHVTAANPPPVALKMEKVYQPCVLLTKKRYVGYSYEGPQQAVPTFDAKGIETVRRDSCAAVAKTMERSLRILFQSHDLSQVKAYLQRQWGKILSGRVSLREFVFAKEVRLGSYSANAAVLPPAAIVATKAMACDPRAEPRYGERVPYVVVHGEPGARLVDLVVDPQELVDSRGGLRLHAAYYITKQIIPSLQRVFGLVGADLRAWFAEVPRVYRASLAKRPQVPLGPVPWWKRVGMGAAGQGGQGGQKGGPAGGVVGSSNGAGGGLGGAHMGGRGRGTIDQYYLSRHCAVCGELMRATETVCNKCWEEPQVAAVALAGRAARLHGEFNHLSAICLHCGGGSGTRGGGIACVSIDCPVFFERRKVQDEARTAASAAADLGFCVPPHF